MRKYWYYVPLRLLCTAFYINATAGMPEYGGENFNVHDVYWSTATCMFDLILTI